MIHLQGGSGGSGGVIAEGISVQKPFFEESLWNVLETERPTCL